IGTIYGLESDGDTHFLVLELVEGEDLSDRIARGALPLEESMGVARQVAHALEAAHDQGVVHRDLKPGNIRITPSGTVKVLDFGLAKAIEGDAGVASGLSQSPTVLTASPTAQGVILGTAAYMSPEQARGKAVDRRADVWAWGCVFYEMLTGRMAFSGETVTDTLAKILEREPDWGSLPPNTPPRVVRVLRRCLTKNVTQRQRDVGDARIEMDDESRDADAADAQAQAAPDTGGKTGGRSIVMVAAVTAIVALAVGFLGDRILRPTPEVPPQKVRRFITPVTGAATRMGMLAVSRDGMMVAYTDAPEASGRLNLVVHPLDQLEGISFPTTASPTSPSFSPDGQWVAYTTATAVQRVSVAGGEPRDVTQTRAYESIHWWRQDEIVMSYVSEKNVRCIARVAAGGGTPEILFAPRDSLQEYEFNNPFVLPGWRGILFDAYSASGRSIVVWDAKTGEIKELIHDNAWSPMYSPTGHLVFINWDSGSLDAVRLDLETLEVKGTPVTVVNSFLWESEYDISDDGMLVYLPQNIEFEGNRILRIMPDGDETALVETGGPWRNPSISTDGNHLLMREVKANCTVWLYDIERASMQRLTFEGDCHNPEFSPDGQYVIYSVENAAARQNFVVPIDGSAQPRPVGGPGTNLRPRSWSRDGKWVADTEVGLRTNADIYLQNMETEERQEPWLQTRFNEQDPDISPDGRWIAYTSDETGQNEVYVSPFDGRASRYVVSVGGGGLARWSPDGKHLYYAHANALYRTTVEATGDAFRASRPEKTIEDLPLLDRDYSVLPDGSVVVVGSTGKGATTGQLVVTLGFFEELKKVVP
ncbi:MAG: protein kinase, partial [Candidatus Latescibacterota bacterium]